MANDPERVGVTYDDAVLFLEGAFRNIDLPPLSDADLLDIREGLWRVVQRLARHRLASTPIIEPDAGLVEKVARALCKYRREVRHAAADLEATTPDVDQRGEG